MKNNIALSVIFYLGLFLSTGCEISSGNKQTSKDKLEKTKISNTLTEDKFTTIDVTDGNGHGPDENSLEGLGAMANHLLRKNKSLNKEKNDFVLSAFNVPKIGENPAHYNVIYRFLKDNIFQMVKMEVKENQVRFISISNHIIEKREVLEYSLRRVLENYKLDSKMRIEDSTNMGDILQSERRIEDVFYPLNYFFSFKDVNLAQFRNVFNQNKSFGEWVNLLQIDLHLKN